MNLATMLLLALLCVLGAALGAAANVAAWRFSLFTPPSGPWTDPPPGEPPRRWLQRVPIVGHLALRREAGDRGVVVWLRPALVELFCACALPLLYRWEVLAAGLQPTLGVPLPPPDPVVVNVQFVVHAALGWLMLVISLIDAEEHYVPDALTIPGTLLGLALAVVAPWSLLPIAWREWQPMVVGFLRMSSPAPWPAALDGSPNLGSLALGLGCWWLWCFAMMDRRWRTGRGLRTAQRLFCARLAREPSTGRLLALGAAGTAVVVATWLWGEASWTGLLSALAGMVIGGGLIWVVRWFGWIALRREAMGFGDVVLLGMIGAFVGWQGCLAVFFLAPLIGVVVGVVTVLVGRSNVIPYGPFLCLAALTTIVCWADVWAAMAERLDMLGFLLPTLVGLALVTMIPMLYLIRKVREALQ